MLAGSTSALHCETLSCEVSAGPGLKQGHRVRSTRSLLTVVPDLR